MTIPFLNNIFYGVDKKKANADFIKMLNEKHALTKNKKEDALACVISSQQNVISPITPPPSPVFIQKKEENLPEEAEKEPLLLPLKQTVYPTSATNTIFWAIYVAFYGLADYQLLGVAKERKRELEEKQKILEFFEKSPKLLKTGGGYKLTNVEVMEYKSDLLLEKDTLRSLVGYSVFYKTNIIVMFKEKNAYLQFTYEDDAEETAPTIVLEYCPKMRAYGLSLEYGTDYDLLSARQRNSREELDKKLEKMFQMEHYEKPLKAIGNYKVANLEDIAKILAINVSSMKKQDMYQAIYRSLAEN